LEDRLWGAGSTKGTASTTQGVKKAKCCAPSGRNRNKRGEGGEGYGGWGGKNLAQKGKGDQDCGPANKSLH